jgi:hypothetical protein
MKKLFLLCTFSPLAVIIIFYYIDASYTLSYLPAMLLLVASALCTAENQLFLKFPGIANQRLLATIPLPVVLTMLYAILLFAPQIRKDVPDAEYWPFQDDGRRSEKHIGLLLKNNLEPGKIMTRWARIAFYADRDWVNIPAGIHLEEIVKTARKQKVRYLIADGLVSGSRPGMGTEIFAPLHDHSKPHGLQFTQDENIRIRGLYPYMVFKHPRSVGVVVYDLAAE